MSTPRRFFFTLATLVAGWHSAHGFDEPKAKPPDPLVGHWKEVSVEANGRVSFATSTVMEFTDGRWTTRDGDGTLIDFGSYRLDDSKNPRWLGMKVERSEPPEVPKRSTEGIYKLDGDSLTIAVSISKDRPDDFVTANKPVLVSVWTRVK